ncbi:hypothetical protein V8F06_014588, partial [Rhypophila decipiens]
AATCYNLQGDEISNTDFIPCDADKPITHCCSSHDLCVENGLCLDNGGDGRITVQGCTDPNWGPPCHAELQDNCQGNKIDRNYVDLWMCRSLTNFGNVELCCGSDDAGCCQSALAGEQKLFKMEKWGQFWTPGQSPTSAVIGGASPGQEGHSSIEPLPIALAAVFGVLLLAVGGFQLRYVARESKRRGKPAGFGALLARQFRLWFRGGIVKEFGDVRYPEEAVELAHSNSTKKVELAHDHSTVQIPELG